MLLMGELANVLLCTYSAVSSCDLSLPAVLVVSLCVERAYCIRQTLQGGVTAMPILELFV